MGAVYQETWIITQTWVTSTFYEKHVSYVSFRFTIIVACFLDTASILIWDDVCSLKCNVKTWKCRGAVYVRFTLLFIACCWQTYPALSQNTERDLRQRHFPFILLSNSSSLHSDCKKYTELKQYCITRTTEKYHRLISYKFLNFQMGYWWWGICLITMPNVKTLIVLTAK